nr:hypothetical protein [Candidatus Woesearchaeota archaeon]
MTIWTQEEINQYRQRESPKLNEMYLEAGILASDPEMRAKYLAEEFLGLTMTDHDLIMRTAKQEGKPKVLNLLEQIAISYI